MQNRDSQCEKKKKIYILNLSKKQNPTYIPTEAMTSAHTHTHSYADTFVPVLQCTFGRLTTHPNISNL